MKPEWLDPKPFDQEAENLRQSAAAVPFLEALKGAIVDEPDADHTKTVLLLDEMIVGERAKVTRALLQDPGLVRRVDRIRNDDR